MFLNYFFLFTQFLSKMMNFRFEIETNVLILIVIIIDYSLFQDAPYVVSLIYCGKICITDYVLCFRTMRL